MDILIAKNPCRHNLMNCAKKKNHDQVQIVAFLHEHFGEANILMALDRKGCDSLLNVMIQQRKDSRSALSSVLTASNDRRSWVTERSYLVVPWKVSFLKNYF